MVLSLRHFLGKQAEARRVRSLARGGRQSQDSNQALWLQSMSPPPLHCAWHCGCSRCWMHFCWMNENTEVWPVQEGNLQQKPCSITLIVLMFPITTPTSLLLFQKWDPVWSRRKKRIEVRCLHPSPGFLPCRLGKERVGTVFSATP